MRKGRRRWMAVSFVWLAGMLFLCPAPSTAATLEDAKRLNAQVIILYQMGRYADAARAARKALSIRQEVLGEKHPDTAESYNNLGMLYDSLGDYVGAEPLYQKALAIFREVLGEKHPDTAASYNNLGALYIAMGDYAKAEPMMQKALAIRKQVLGEKHPDTAQSYNNLGMLYDSLGDYVEAKPLYQKALTIRKEVLGEKHPDTAQSYNNLGMLYDSLGDYAGAEPMMEKSLTIRKEVLGEKHPDTANSYNNLGALYKAVGDYAKAELMYQKALAIVREFLGEKHPNTATTYNNLGVLYDSMGYYAKAELIYQKVLAIRQEVLGEKHPDTATSYGSLGVLYDSLGDYAGAEPMMEKSLTIRKEVLGEKHPYTANSYNNLGMLYYSMGDYARAEPMIQKALAIRKQVLGEKHPDTAQSYNNLGVLYQAMGDYARAEQMMQKDLAIVREVVGEKHPDTTGSYNNLGALYLAQGKVDKALAIFRQTSSTSGIGHCYLAKGDYKEALVQFEESLSYLTASGEKEFLIANYIGLGLSYEGLKQYGNARKEFEQAIEVMEGQWATMPFAARRTFLEGKAGNLARLDAYEGLVRVIIQEKRQGYERESLEVAERVKSRTLLEMLAARGPEGIGKQDQEILARDRQMQIEIAGLAMTSNKLRELGTKAPTGRLAEVERELNKARDAYEQFINEVKLKNVEAAALITTETVDVAQIQKLLDSSTAIVEYFTTKDKTYAWVITRDRITVSEIDIGNKAVIAMVDGMILPNMSNQSRRPAPKMILSTGGEILKDASEAERKKNRERFLNVAQEAYRAFFKPIAGQVGEKNLIVVPHGALHKTPFSAMHDGERFLMERYGLSFSPSLSVLPHVVKKRSKNEGRFLAFADPVTEAVPLGFAEMEVKSIQGFFPKKEVYARDQATETKVRERAASHDVIHFACHGEFNDKQPMQSGLLLARDGKNDGYLQVHEIFGIDLRNANLVCLSACETGLSKVFGGDDMVGLSRGFIYAGTPSLMATLWQVDDQSTSILIQAFYDNWQKKGMSKPEALRQAQMTVRSMKGYEHPFYWAGFVMIGDWM